MSRWRVGRAGSSKARGGPVDVCKGRYRLLKTAAGRLKLDPVGTTLWALNPLPVLLSWLNAGRRWPRTTPPACRGTAPQPLRCLTRRFGDGQAPPPPSAPPGKNGHGTGWLVWSNDLL